MRAWQKARFTREGMRLVDSDESSPRGVRAGGLWFDLISAYGSMKELAEWLGVAPNAIYRWARGCGTREGNAERVLRAATRKGLPAPAMKVVR
jgi:hypothetical protein